MFKTEKNLMLWLGTLCISGCLSSPPDKEEEKEWDFPEVIDDTRTFWQDFTIVTPKADGLMVPYFDAEIDERGRIHIVYYELSDQVNEDPNARDNSLYNIQYDVWDTRINALEHGEDAITAVTLDHTDRIALDRDASGKLYLAYRGGEPKECGETLADAMFSVFDGNQWTEYTGAMGYVERSAGPLLDGDAGANADLVVADDGTVHLTYQFNYEGCDNNNMLHPDLFYVQKTPEQFTNDSRSFLDLEEQVSGNHYEEGGGNSQNATGPVTDVILTKDAKPLTFHYAEKPGAGSRGLYMGYRNSDGTWQEQTIMEGCEVVDVVGGEDAEGNLHVFYVEKTCTEVYDTEFALRHAYKPAETQTTKTVDGEEQLLSWHEIPWQLGNVIDNVKVGGIGRHLSMVFNKNGMPQLPYYELSTYSGEERKDLKSIELTKTGYASKDVAKWNDVGYYSKMLTDKDGEIYILSYAPSTKSIHLFIEGINGRQ